MSSHHIVRDEQEPAVIIHQLGDFSFERLGTMLEWSPTVICCEDAIDEVLDLGIKIDIVIVNSIGDHVGLSNQSPLKVVVVKDDDPITTSLQLLLSSDHKAANIITSQKNLEVVIQSGMAVMPQMDLTFWETCHRHILIRKDHFQKWLPKHTQFSIGSLGDQLHLEVIMSGGETLRFEEGKGYQTAQEGLVSIRSNHAPYIYTERLD